MKVASELALAGLAGAFRDFSLRERMRLYDEYEKVERHDSVSGVGQRGRSDDDKQFVLELEE